MPKNAHQEEHQESAPHIVEDRKGFHGQAVFDDQVAGRGNVFEDIADEDQRDNFKLVGDRAGHRCGQRRNEDQHLVEQDEFKRRRNRGQVVFPGLGDERRRDARTPSYRRPERDWQSAHGG